MKKILLFLGFTSLLFANNCPTNTEKQSFALIGAIQGAVLGGPVGFLYGITMVKYGLECENPESCNKTTKTVETKKTSTNLKGLEKPVITTVTTPIKKEIPAKIMKLRDKYLPTNKLKKELPPIKTIKTIDSVALFKFDSIIIVKNDISKYNLSNDKISKIEVIGHTCSIGTEQYNEDLALKRAETVAFLLSKKGIDKSKMIVTSLGETQPISKTLSKNRRVELKVQQK